MANRHALPRQGVVKGCGQPIRGKPVNYPAPLGRGFPAMVA